MPPSDNSVYPDEDRDAARRQDNAQQTTLRPMMQPQSFPSPQTSSANYLLERSQPAPALVPFVDNFQMVELPKGGLLPRVLPGTGAILLFPLHCALTVSNLHEAQQQIISDPFLICNRHHVLDFSSVGPAKFLAVSFRPGRLRYFTRKSFVDLQDRVSCATDLWGDSVQRARGHLSEAADFSARAACVSEFLIKLLGDKRESRLDLLMDLLYLSPATRISDVAGEAGWSLRHFERLFTSTFGISPKYFARVTRLQRVARKLALDPLTSLCGSALDAGFFDQSHFVHEVRRLAGLTPGELAEGVRKRPHFYNPKSLQAYIAMLRNASPDKPGAGEMDDQVAAWRAKTLDEAQRLVSA